MKYLEALGLDNKSVLDELEKAAHAHRRYLVQSAERGIVLQPSDVVSLTIMHHMMLLDSLATLDGVSHVDMQRAVARGKASGGSL